MKNPEFTLLRTSAVKLAIKSIFIYGFALLMILISLNWVSQNYINEKIESELQQELIELQSLYSHSGQEELIAYIKNNQLISNHVYYYQSVNETKLAGNLYEWPEDSDIKFNMQVQGYWVEEDAIPVSLHDDDAFWPLIATSFADGSRLLIGRNVKQAKLLLEFSEFMIEAMGVAIIFACIISLILARKILRRINIISQTANNIMGGDLSQRIPLSKNHDEFDALSTHLNTMLDRIQKLIRGIRDVTDNIAHDLRSPLTRMRNQMEITLLESRSVDEYKNVLHQNIEDLEQLVSTFNALLSIAQTEAGNHRTQWSMVNLKQLATDLMELYQPLAENRGQTLQLINGSDSFIHGSRDLLAQSFGNLIENAIKYTPKNGLINLRINTTADYIEVIVEDTGPGIVDADKKRVFEKFVRLDGSRNAPGNGLGLSLVAAVASLHKAELILQDANPGLCVIQRFPRNLVL